MKKFIISTAVLKPILAKLGQAVTKNSTLPVLADMHCKVTKGKVEFITTDLELTIIYECTAETIGYPFELLIPFDFFKSIVNLSPDQPLCLELAGKTSDKAIINCEHEVYELKELDSTINFPKIPDVPKRNPLELSKEFITGINKALIAVSKDELRPAMTKVCLDIKESKTTIASTDAHCLFTRNFEMPSKVVDQLLISPKIAKVLHGVEKVSLSWGKSHIGFQCESFCIVATRHEDKYPNYRAVIPKTEKNLSIEKNSLRRALEKCGLSSDQAKKTTILLKKKRGMIVLEVDDVDMGRTMTFDVAAEYSGDCDFVVLNSDLLLKMLSILDYDSIHLHIESPSKGILITCDDDDQYLGMVMPLMV